MEEKKDILSDPGLKKNPFSLPDSYVSTLEENVHARISGTREKPVITLLKPTFALLMTFALIFGFAYGIIPLANRYLAKSPFETDPILALIEEGYLNSSFIEDYYDEIPSIRPETLSDPELELLQSENITTDDIIYHLEEELSE